MEVLKGFLGFLWKFLIFFPIFILLLFLGITKAVLTGPIVFFVIVLGNSAVILGLWPLHVIWTYYTILKTKKFGIILKGLLCLNLPIPLFLWPLVGFIGSFLVGLVYGLFWPLMSTFETMDEEVRNKLVRRFTNGTWSSVLGGCTIVRDLADVCFHSYFSVMDGMLELKTDKPTEIKISQVPGCALAGILGALIDVPIITGIVIIKSPILLFKGWNQLVKDLIGRSGPFLETLCVPFAGISILLWPIAVALAALVGISSSIFLGFYAAAVAYQENSTRRGLLYIIAVLSLFDEYTNDLLDLHGGSCFPRPRYREGVDSDLLLVPVKQPEQPEFVQPKQHPVRTPSMKMQALKAVAIWDNLFKACEYTGKELVNAGAISLEDLEQWQYSKNEIINIGIPSCMFLQCFFRSIRSGSTGFLMRDNVELTLENRPEGRVFDFLYEPMSIMKDQIKLLDLQETEELYLYKYSLYCGVSQRVETCKNGGFPPDDGIRKAQIEGISRRLQGFCLTLSRLPTFRRRFHEVVKALVQEANRKRNPTESETSIEP